jgi:glycerophosphoryl diester phosphodiesterase
VSIFSKYLPHLGRLGRATRWRRGKGHRPRVWAHRGASALAPENTMAAFQRAVDDHADGLELDVRLDGDGHVVCFHDETLDRLCGRPGLFAALSAAERAALRVQGEPLPLLADVLAAFDCEVDVEIKVEHAGRARALVAATARVIAAARQPDRVLVSSFDPIALVQMHHALPTMAIAYLFHDEQSLVARRGWLGNALGATLVHPQHTLCTEATVGAWHRAGMPVNAWTVDDPAELRRLADLGVDGVFANDPGAAIAILEGN